MRPNSLAALAGAPPAGWLLAALEGHRTPAAAFRPAVPSSEPAVWTLEEWS
jgi:hypothetical protein